MPNGLTEVPLVGGTNNRGLVVRRGDTVRRPLRPTSTAVHALLSYLAEVGFDGAPRLLGIDDQDREVLTFIPGDAVTPPYPAWALTDDALRSVAQLLRRYHEAVAGFDVEGHDWPNVAPPEYDEGLACHDDLNLDNVIFRNGRAVALIDFDWATPGSAVWDVADAIRLWAPLRPGRYVDDTRRGRGLERMRTFVDAYGIELDPERLVHAVRLNHDRMYRLIEDGAEAGNEGFAAYWAESEQRVADTRAWYAEQHETLIKALL
ncbi:MAG TPA: phosphotransferase [Propionibacteriaceae bacterium]|nr:phosphotransferase [Propionibacteriaceae bacterium]